MQLDKEQIVYLTTQEEVDLFMLMKQHQLMLAKMIRAKIFEESFVKIDFHIGDQGHISNIVVHKEFRE